MLKEYTLAMDDFNMALSLDTQNEEAKQGLQQIRMSIYSPEKDELVTQNAMKDPNVKVACPSSPCEMFKRSAAFMSLMRDAGHSHRPLHQQLAQGHADQPASGTARHV